jgi:hypothetical protein
MEAAVRQREEIGAARACQRQHARAAHGDVRLYTLRNQLIHGAPKQVAWSSLEALRVKIRAHADTVSKAMRGNLERWIIK